YKQIHQNVLQQRLGEREIPFTPRASGFAGRETHREPFCVHAFHAAVDPPDTKADTSVVGGRTIVQRFRAASAEAFQSAAISSGCICAQSPLARKTSWGRTGDHRDARRTTVIDSFRAGASTV